MENFRGVRQASKVSQITLAQKSGVPRWRIAHFELGLAKLTPEEYSRVLKALADVVSENAKVVGLMELTGS